MDNRKSFINVRGGFSDTSGVAPCNTEMQLYEFDQRTRILISNTMFDLLKNIFENAYELFHAPDADSEFCEAVLSNVFVEPVRLLYGRKFNWNEVFREKFDLVFFEASYNEILDLLWYTCKWIHDHMSNREINNVIYDVFNNVFEKEYVGYRFVDGQIIAITDEQEIGEIEEACRNPYEGCRSHLKKAVLYSKIRPKLNKVCIAPFPGLCSADMYPIESKQNIRFLMYCMLSDAFVGQVSMITEDRVKMPKINQDELSSLLLAFPPTRPEQQAIANFLDSKCTEIDAVLEKTRTSIEEYKKLKQAIITQAVTKGVRGDRPMKESGIAWIGSIPSEWDVSTLGKFIAIDSGISIGRKYELETPLVEVPYLRVANVQGDHLDLSDVATIMVTPEEAEKYRLKAGQLLMTEGGDRDKLGRGCLWNGEIENCIHQNHVFSVQTDDRLTVRYLDYLTTSEVARVYFDVTAKKTTNLACTSKSTIQKFVIPIPSVTEQRAICNYLDEKCQKLDRVLQKKESIIEQLDSYKKSVIYEYITGKKEV